MRPIFSTNAPFCNAASGHFEEGVEWAGFPTLGSDDIKARLFISAWEQVINNYRECIQQRVPGPRAPGTANARVYVDSGSHSHIVNNNVIWNAERGIILNAPVANSNAPEPPQIARSCG
jgi:hypothetical protein